MVYLLSRFFPTSNGQRWPLRQAAALDLQQALFPGLCAHAVAIPEPGALFVAGHISTNKHQNTMPRVLQPGLQVHTVDPEIDVAFARQVPLLPLRQFLLPPCLSRLSVARDNPGASGPKRACKASEKSPVEMPLRYSHGRSASRLFERRI